MFDLKKWIAKVMNSIAKKVDYSDLVVVKHTPSSHSVPKGNYEGWTIGPFTKSGYYPLGIVGYDMSGSGTSNCVQIKYYPINVGSGTISAYIGVKNNSTSGAVPVTFAIWVLWLKIR